jgi:hypothetical protein
MACTRRRLAPALACAALLGAGCERIIGADFGSVEIVNCAHVAPPGRPDVQASGGNVALTIAVHSVDLGDTTDQNGNPGYRSIGFDLDGVCTNETQAPSCRPVPWANGDPTDGFDGRDNGIGRLVFEEALEFGSAPVTSQTITSGTQDGTLAPVGIVRIRGYNLRVDDDQVEVDWYLPLRLTAGDAGRTPAWDGGDVWPITLGTLVDAGTESGGSGNDSYPPSIFRDPNAYVSNYTVVAHIPSMVIQLSNVPASVEQVAVMLSLAINPLRLVRATIAGRVRLSELFSKLPQITQQFGVGAICLGDPSYPRLKQFFCSHAEILASGQVDPSVDCDALSFAISFDGAPVQLGPPAPQPVASGCPPATDPAQDDCTNGASSPGSDAATDAPPTNCVAPGTPNNEKGVGGYCQTSADCISSVSVCSALFGAPPGDWFCTKLCTLDTECGTGAYCAHDPRGMACVPLPCGSPDAGTDAAVTDATGGTG